MAALKFSNGEINKIVRTVARGKKWELVTPSDDGKFTITLRNDPKNSKIDVLADDKYVDDYPYDIDEDQDVYATVLNVLDYLTNLMNKYNKKNPMTEAEEPEVKKTFFSLEIDAEEFQEAISKGMLKAYARKMKEGDISYTCKDCGHAMPKYRGQYPRNCPNCNADIKAMKEADKDEAIWGGPFKRGEVVKVKLEDPNEFYEAKLVTYNPTDNTYGAQLECGDDAGKIIQGITTKQIK